MKKRRVVITGMGMVSPLGLAVDQTWSAILAGKSGISRIDSFDSTGFRAKIAGLVKDFDVHQYIHSKQALKLDIFIHYAAAATAEAIKDANLDINQNNAQRIGTAIGSGIGGLTCIENNCRALHTQGPRKISPFFVPSSIINMASGYVAIVHGLKGPNISIVSACTTGAHNIGYAARTISYGDADVMIAGGTEKASNALGIGGFSAARALSTRYNDDPEKASRPWDRDRDGFVLSDGAGVVVLESYEHAKSRNARCYAEVAGFGMSADAYHITLPEPQGEGFAATMHNALADAGCLPDAIDYINAHGTSTRIGDKTEALAIRRVFGDHADKLAVSSTKSMVGHMIGAAGAVEAILTVLAIRDQVVPPTINLDHPDEGCHLNFIPHRSQSRPIQCALSNSFGFGGTNAALVFKQLD